MRKILCRRLFDVMAALGRPVGGIRPRRIANYLGHIGYDGDENAKFRWRRDRWGTQLHLSPRHFLDRQIIATGAYDADLNRFIERRVQAGMVCFDVGANIGVVAIHLARRVGETGRVHAFEPVPPILKRLRGNIARNHAENIVLVHAVALSDRCGVTTISYNDEIKSNQGGASLVNTDAGSLRCQISATTLDEFVAANDIRKIDLMKIDIQGAEPLLLAGGRKTLEKLGPDLLMEISPDDLRGCGYNSKSLVEAVFSLGYRIYRITGGKMSESLDPSGVKEDLFIDNVYCTRRPPN